MGNITSNEGENKKSNNKQTPLNLFIEKVLNEDYFFTPELTDDSINDVDLNDINNNKVLLKRALCTGTTYIPISLSYLNKNNNKLENYTVKINATDKDNYKLPNIEEITGPAYVQTGGLLNELKNTYGNVKNITEVDDFLLASNIKIENNNDKQILDLFKYRQIQDNFSENDGEYTYSTAIAPLPRLGYSNGCQLFYKGTKGDITDYDKSDYSNSYNPKNNVSKAFCGKVLQYDNIMKENELTKEKIGRFTIKKFGEGNQYRTDEFTDCACLNSIIAVNSALFSGIMSLLINNRATFCDIFFPL